MPLHPLRVISSACVAARDACGTSPRARFGGHFRPPCSKRWRFPFRRQCIRKSRSSISISQTPAVFHSSSVHAQIALFDFHIPDAGGFSFVVSACANRAAASIPLSSHFPVCIIRLDTWTRTGWIVHIANTTHCRMDGEQCPIAQIERVLSRRADRLSWSCALSR